jgi:hypothetical protein
MIEHELRFALTPGMVAEFEQRAAIGLTGPSTPLWSRYFDTSAGDLGKASLSLRVRQTAAGFVQTLRAPGCGRFERFEWSRQVSSEHPELDALPPPSHPEGALVRACFDLLAAVFETRFGRQSRLVRPQPGVRVELACDRGEIRAGARSELVAEVALVRKEGPAAAFYHYAVQWARLHQAKLMLSPKSLRGLRLAGYAAERPRARPSKLQQHPALAPLAVADAARQVLGGHLDDLLDGIGSVLDARDGDRGGSHQLHQALHRFKSAIRFFGLHLQGGGTEPLEDGNGAKDAEPVVDRETSIDDADPSAIWRELERLARGLGQAAAPVCHADRLVSGLLARLEASFPGDPAVRLLDRSLAFERERARARLRDAVSSGEATCFVIQALAAIESLPPDRWQQAPFERFALARRQALVRRLRRRTRLAARERQWQAVRTASRSLRDALESCRELPVSAMPVDAAIASLIRCPPAIAPGRRLAFTQAVAARARSAPDAPAAVATRAVALVDGYLAGGAPSCSPLALRESILALSQRLLRPASARQAEGERLIADSAGAAAAADRAGRSGYHPESPSQRASAAPEAALPHVEPCKEDPE